MRYIPSLPAFNSGLPERRLLSRNVNSMRGPENSRVPDNIRKEVWNRMAEMIASKNGSAEIIHTLLQQFDDRAVDMQLLRAADIDIREMAKKYLGLTDVQLRAVEPRSMNETYDFLMRVHNKLGNNAPGVVLQPQISPIQQPISNPAVSGGPVAPTMTPPSVTLAGPPPPAAAPAAPPPRAPSVPASPSVPSAPSSPTAAPIPLPPSPEPEESSDDRAEEMRVWLLARLVIDSSFDEVQSKNAMDLLGGLDNELLKALVDAYKEREDPHSILTIPKNDKRSMVTWLLVRQIIDDAFDPLKRMDAQVKFLRMSLEELKAEVAAYNGRLNRPTSVPTAKPSEVPAAPSSSTPAPDKKRSPEYKNASINLQQWEKEMMPILKKEFPAITWEIAYYTAPDNTPCLLLRTPTNRGAWGEYRIYANGNLDIVPHSALIQKNIASASDVAAKIIAHLRNEEVLLKQSQEEKARRWKDIEKKSQETRDRFPALRTSLLDKLQEKGVDATALPDAAGPNGCRFQIRIGAQVIPCYVSVDIQDSSNAFCTIHTEGKGSRVALASCSIANFDKVIVDDLAKECEPIVKCWEETFKMVTALEARLAKATLSGCSSKDMHPVLAGSGHIELQFDTPQGVPISYHYFVLPKDGKIQIHTADIFHRVGDAVTPEGQAEKMVTQIEKRLKLDSAQAYVQQKLLTALNVPPAYVVEPLGGAHPERWQRMFVDRGDRSTGTSLYWSVEGDAVRLWPYSDPNKPSLRCAIAELSTKFRPWFDAETPSPKPAIVPSVPNASEAGQPKPVKEETIVKGGYTLKFVTPDQLQIIEQAERDGFVFKESRIWPDAIEMSFKGKSGYADRMGVVRSGDSYREQNLRVIGIINQLRSEVQKDADKLAAIKFDGTFVNVNTVLDSRAQMRKFQSLDFEGKKESLLAMKKLDMPDPISNNLIESQVVKAFMNTPIVYIQKHIAGLDWNDQKSISKLHTKDLYENLHDLQKIYFQMQKSEGMMLSPEKQKFYAQFEVRMYCLIFFDVAMENRIRELSGRPPLDIDDNPYEF